MLLSRDQPLAGIGASYRVSSDPHYIQYLNSTPPHVKPAPKAIISTRSP